jgi:hypothetical protein
MRTGGKMMRTLVVVLILAALTGCPDSSSSSLTGTWLGVIEDQIRGSGTLEVEIVQQGGGLSGIWYAWFLEPEFELAGAVSGSADDGTFAATLSPSDSDYCAMSLVGSWHDDTLEASYVALDCSEGDVGTISLERNDEE